MFGFVICLGFTQNADQGFIMEVEKIFPFNICWRIVFFYYLLSIIIFLNNKIHHFYCHSYNSYVNKCFWFWTIYAASKRTTKPSRVAVLWRARFNQSPFRTCHCKCNHWQRCDCCLLIVFVVVLLWPTSRFTSRALVATVRLARASQRLLLLSTSQPRVAQHQPVQQQQQRPLATMRRQLSSPLTPCWTRCWHYSTTIIALPPTTMNTAVTSSHHRHPLQLLCLIK